MDGIAAEPPELTGLSGWVVDVVDALGVVGVGLLVFLENLFPPVPSEVILPLSGYLAGTGRFDPFAVVGAATCGSVLGALALYGLGARLGEDRLRTLFRRVPLLEERDLDRAGAWFARHGGRAVLIGRVIPVVRSLISIPAGVQRMPLPRFVLYTFVGSAAWNGLFVGLGYALGSRWTQIGRYSDVINAVVIAALVAVVLLFVGKRLRRRATHRPLAAETGDAP